MKHLVYDQSREDYPVVILVKESAFDAATFERIYLSKLIQSGVERNQVLIVGLPYKNNNKAPKKFIQEQLETILPNLASVNAKYILCADSNYFKVLAGTAKAEQHLGYCLPCAVKDYEHLDIVLGINHRALVHNPNNEPKFDMGLTTFASVINGTYEGLGKNIIKTAIYPKGTEETRQFLESLHQYPTLAVDIEAFSLKCYEAGVGTVGFAWNTSEGGVITCDYLALSEPDDNKQHGIFSHDYITRKLLKEFFESYQGTMIWHGSTYDLKCLIWAIWMQHDKDYVGMQTGLDYLTRNLHDTKLIAYLTTNSAAGNELGLKALARPFAGDWAEDVKDIRKIPHKELLKYNLVDALSTFWVFETYYPQLYTESQDELYYGMMLPSSKVITYMEMVGMPMIPREVQRAKQKLEDVVAAQDKILDCSITIQKFTLDLQQKVCDKANSKLKTKQHPVSHFSHVKFNPNSDTQLQALLYETMNLPVLNKTKSGAPSADGKTLTSLCNHTDNKGYLDILNALIDRAKAQKILESFIPNFEAGIPKGDGRTWLHGNFNLGGTISGRLSSSRPNLQQIPSGSEYGSLVKQCFAAPKGFIFCGADFASLEDRINALLTKDPNKLKVYEDGFDGHCYRTYAYWPEQFPHINPEDPDSINSIQKTHSKLRGKSKAPTFALTYAGTWTTLVNSSGFTPEEAKAIEANYHKLYATSAQWTQEQLLEASKQGYAEAAFGLRIRTPLLQRTFLNKSSTPREAAAEARSLGNAISGQSYGLLTNRACNAVMERVWASEYRYDILPVAMIHDAIYFLCKDDVSVITWLNRVLIEEMKWQELPEIQHDTVKLGAELGLFWPSWDNEIVLPNEASEEEIKQLCYQAQKEVNDASSKLEGT